MLETEIKNLVAQIEKLNSNFEALFKPANTPETKPEPVQEKAPADNAPEEKTQDLPKREDLKDLALAKIRGNRDNKEKVKAILSDCGVGAFDELEDKDLLKVKEKVAAL